MLSSKQLLSIGLSLIKMRKTVGKMGRNKKRVTMMSSVFNLFTNVIKYIYIVICIGCISMQAKKKKGNFFFRSEKANFY